MQIDKFKEYNNNEGIINLENLSFEFCSDDFLNELYTKELNEIKDKDEWIEKNKNKLEKGKEEVNKMIELGIISDSNPETIWFYKFNNTKEELKKILIIKKELQNSINEIKIDVANKLSKFLPNWKAGKLKIFFTINKDADYCIKDDAITIDLKRLSHKENIIEDTKKGITHEVFHHYFSKKFNLSNIDKNKISLKDYKDQIIFSCIDEGLAVLIGGQSLKSHHEQKGKDFEKYKDESFIYFNNFLKENDFNSLNNNIFLGFKDMGYFYVVGNEIAKTILEKEGIVSFRKFILEAKKNPNCFLEKYKEISKNNNKLQKINL